MPFALGKLPASPSAKDFKLADVLKVSFPIPPLRFGFGRLYADWGMLGNDRYGDCVLAGADHETMLYNYVNKGHKVEFDDAVCLGDYGAVTGFDPATGDGDTGTYVKDAMSFRRKTGVLASDFSGRHKIDAYVSIDPGNWDMMVKATYTFGAVGIGFNVPDNIWSQTGGGHVWDFTDPNASIIGGHYVPIVGSMDHRSRVTCITWGARQELTKEFYQEYNDEAWVPLSLETVRSGYGLRHLDVQALHDLLAQL